MSAGAEYSRTAPLFEVLRRIPAGPDAVRAVVERVDPSAMADAAARHGLSTWVADAFAAAGVSLERHPRLSGDARAQVVAGHKLKRFALTVFDALQAARLSPIVLKGPVLAERLYPSNPLGRPSVDLDVLVGAEELGRVAEALRAVRLRRHDDPALADPLEDHHHQAFAGSAGLVEAHFKLISAFGGATFDDDGLRARAEPFSFEGRTVQVLSKEDEFLYLAVHAANHGFLRLSWLVDLQQYVLRGLALDYPLTAARAEQAGFRRPLEVALRLVDQLLPDGLPPAARALVRSPVVVGALDERLFSPTQVERARFSAHRAGNFGLRLWMMDTPRQGVKEVFDGLKRYTRRKLTNA